MATTTINWSEQQRAIFDWFKDGIGNLVIVARAGTGKTTTVLEGTKHASERSILFCAFNKKNAVELGQKLTNPNAEAKTLHSLGFAFVRRNWENVRVDTKGERLRKFVKQVCKSRTPDEVLRLVAKLVSAAKGCAPLATDANELLDLAYQFDCVPDEEWIEDGYDTAWVCHRAVEVLELCATERDGWCDFDDMIYLPVRNRWIRAWYDLVVVDEAQDMNMAQLIIAQGACRKTGRIVVVGDDRQAIYAFRGADSGSIARLHRELKATELKLTITYRCPKKVVDLAAAIVPDYRAHERAPDGNVRDAGRDAMLEEAREGDFILSRKNAPLASVCLALLKQGKRAKIEGRDIGAGLRALIKKLATGRVKDSMPKFLERLTVWEKREVARAERSAHKGFQTRIDYVRDQADLIRALAEGLSGVRELESRITALFADGPGDGPRIVCSSVHRAKGLEAQRVYLLADTFRDDGDIEEANIKYVAITRSQRELVWVREL